jgi:uncharacterized repeat protein (TIGR03803 family)
MTRGTIGAATVFVLCGMHNGVSAATSEVVLYSFCARSSCTDGSTPNAGVITDQSGNLYGTTEVGGINEQGTVFALAHNGTETVRYSFPGQTNDGYNPFASLFEDMKHNLYGTTAYGGLHGGGAVFILSRKNTESLNYSFCTLDNCADGQQPMSNVIMDAAGNVYGTTTYGGAHGFGTVFKLTPNKGESVLYSFCPNTGCDDGKNPMAGLVADGRGNLYGTTPYGGANGDGTVFEITNKRKEKTVYSFCPESGCPDGANPLAGLIMDEPGNLYGTTLFSGAHGSGVIFKIAPDGKESVLYSFCSDFNCADGSSPEAGLIMDKAGNLYGTTYRGGTNAQGAVFEYSPKRNVETVLYSFCSQSNCADGVNPIAGLLPDKKGNLFGTTLGGGVYNAGTVFEIHRK